MARDPATAVPVPFVYACSGRSSAARRAQAVAAGLERVGVAEVRSLVAVAAGAASAARVARAGRVISVSGCAERCPERILRSRAISVEESVLVDAATLDVLGVRRLAASIGRRRERSPAVLGRPQDSQLARRPHGDYVGVRYLRALADLDSDRATAAEIARRAGVTRASAGEALELLQRRRLVARAPDRRFVLTAAGVEAVRDITWRQRVVERFLTDFVGYHPEAVDDLAAPIARELPGEAVERLFRRLGAPALCPHGRPIIPPALP